jgi:ribosome maturation factor RimP
MIAAAPELAESSGKRRLQREARWNHSSGAESVMRQANDRLTALVASVVEPMGYEMLGVEYSSAGTQEAVLRVYIDHPNGIKVEDCEAVSRQLSGVLDVEDPISGHYDLEVSSPGLDRPLFTLEQIERQRGGRIRVRLAQKLEGRRNFEGELLALSEDRQSLELRLDEGKERRLVRLPVAQIESARVVPEFNFSQALHSPLADEPDAGRG